MRKNLIISVILLVCSLTLCILSVRLTDTELQLLGISYIQKNDKEGIKTPDMLLFPFETDIFTENGIKGDRVYLDEFLQTVTCFGTDLYSENESIPTAKKDENGKYYIDKSMLDNVPFSFIREGWLCTVTDLKITSSNLYKLKSCVREKNSYIMKFEMSDGSDYIMTLRLNIFGRLKKIETTT